MKKLLFITAAVLLASPLAAFAYDPVLYTTSGDNTMVVGGGGAGITVDISGYSGIAGKRITAIGFTEYGTNDINFSIGGGSCDYTYNTGTAGFAGSWTPIVREDFNYDFPSDLSGCTFHPNAVNPPQYMKGVTGSHYFLTFYGIDIPTPPPAAVIGSMVTAASTTFTGALGFNWENTTSFMGKLLNEVMGSGLGMLALLLPYIIGLIIISAIVYFLFAGFRYFKH